MYPALPHTHGRTVTDMRFCHVHPADTFPWFQPLPHPPRHSGSVSEWMQSLPHKSVYQQAVSQNFCEGYAGNKNIKIKEEMILQTRSNTSGKEIKKTIPRMVAYVQSWFVALEK